VKLSIKQTLALDTLEDKITNEILYGGGAGGGKSVVGTYWLVKSCLKYQATRWLMGRSVLKTLKDTTLNSMFWVFEKQQLKPDIHFKYNEIKGAVKFWNGSEIILKDLESYPSDPNFDELGSLEITGAFVDECNQISKKAWNIVKSRIRYKLDENDLIPKMLGTCNPDKGWIYEDFYQPSKKGELPVNKKFIPALVTDNPDVSRHYRENLMSLDENSKQRLLYGNFEYDDDPATLINRDRITDSFSNTFIEPGEKYITADIARFGGDNTVIGEWEGFRVVLHSYSKLSVTESAAKIEEYRIKNGIPISNVLVDEDGVGGGVKDILKCHGFVNNSTPLIHPVTKMPENYINLKSQCYFKMAERMNAAGIYINCQDPAMKAKIIQELEQVKQYNMDKDTKKAVLPKDKVKEIIGRSPDFSDTLMMREWFELAPKFHFWTT